MSEVRGVRGEGGVGGVGVVGGVRGLDEGRKLFFPPLHPRSIYFSIYLPCWIWSQRNAAEVVSIGMTCGTPWEMKWFQELRSIRAKTITWMFLLPPLGRASSCSRSWADLFASQEKGENRREKTQNLEGSWRKQYDKQYYRGSSHKCRGVILNPRNKSRMIRLSAGEIERYGNNWSHF